MHLIGTELEDFCVQAYHAGEFEEVTKESVLGHWSVFFFYPADFLSHAGRSGRKTGPLFWRTG